MGTYDTQCGRVGRVFRLDFHTELAQCRELPSVVDDLIYALFVEGFLLPYPA